MVTQIGTTGYSRITVVAERAVCNKHEKPSDPHPLRRLVGAALQVLLVERAQRQHQLHVFHRSAAALLNERLQRFHQAHAMLVHGLRQPLQNLLFDLPQFLWQFL